MSVISSHAGIASSLVAFSVAVTASFAGVMGADAVDPAGKAGMAVGNWRLS